MCPNHSRQRKEPTITNENTTAAIPKAIIAQREKSFFAAYLATTVPGQTDNVADYYMSGFECFGMNEMLKELVVNILYGDPAPEDEIDLMLQELSGLIGNLHRVKRGFQAYKTSQAEAV